MKGLFRWLGIFVFGFVTDPLWQVLFSFVSDNSVAVEVLSWIGVAGTIVGLLVLMKDE